jgi:hypothetical protein
MQQAASSLSGFVRRFIGDPDACQDTQGPARLADLALCDSYLEGVADLFSLDEMASSNHANGESHPGVHAVTLKLPPFWPKQACMWFHTVEAQFNLRGITEDQTKFDYTLTTLDADTQERVADFFDDMPKPGTRYEALKTRILESFRVNQHQRMSALVNLIMGDDTPTRLLDRMLGFYRPDLNAAGNPLFRFHFLQKLPAHVRDQVAALDHLGLRELAQFADKVYAQREPSATCLVQEPEEIDAVQRFPNRQKQQVLRSATRAPGVCKYHSRFGEHARSCILPCIWSGKIKPIPGNAIAGRQ